MTYDDIKSKYLLGCDVKTSPVATCPNSLYKGEKRGDEPKDQQCEGKLLAVLDPSKHGPRCLLFKIEKPEGRKISNEKALQTIRRKIPIHHHEHLSGQWAIEGGMGEVWQNTALSIMDEELSPEDFGLLKWITPSEVKERMDVKTVHKPQTPGPSFVRDEAANIDPEAIKKVRSTMNDRTEQLKRILKPGMKVKLKGTTEGNWETERSGPGFKDEMNRFLGKWVEVKEYGEETHICEDRFRAKHYAWPLTMIDKVEGEEGDDYWYCERCDDYVHPRSVTYEEKHDRCGGELQPTMGKSLPKRDTIPVPRETVKEELREHGQIAAVWLQGPMGKDLIDTLLQEIEEEEKYFQLPVGELKDEQGNVIADIGSDHITPIYDVCVPEIHKEGDSYIVKFKRED